MHVIHERELPLVIENVALLTGDGYVALLPTNEEELIPLGDVEGLEVAWEVVLGELVFIEELQLSVVLLPFYVVVHLEGVSVEGNDGHAEVGIVCYLTELVYLLYISLDEAERGVLELTALEELSAFLEFSFYKL